jgi:hypothetical protein
MAQNAVEGVPIPQDFDGELYSRVYRAIERKYAIPSQKSFQQVAWALQGLVYRFTACAEHDDAFTASFKAHGHPLQPERYQQEKHLFGFFVTGLSALECFAYASYWLGSLLDAAAFPTGTDQSLRAITCPHTAACFGRRFPNDPLESTTKRLFDSQEFQRWAEIRNMLAHRSHPGRAIYASIGSAPEKPTEWVKDIVIDVKTTRSRRTWLSTGITELLNAAETFVAAH